jgi:hypothetical protein
MNGMTVVRKGARGEKPEKPDPAIKFGTQRPAVNRGGPRRFFAPVKNMIGSAVESATGNPRAILRMVSGYC